MLAVDAATEMRSMTLLYERWADRIYRYFLLCTADPAVADRMMQDLLITLPEDLQRFAGQEKSFGGWLFGRASEVFWREHSVPSRMYRRLTRYLPSRGSSSDEIDDTPNPQSAGPELSGFEEVAPALALLTPDRREVLGIQFGARLKTASAAEALRLPASLMSSHVQWAMDSLAEQLDTANNRRFQEDVEYLVDRQVLTGTQRQKHFTLIHGMFTGDFEMESSEPQRAPVFEIGALIGVVVLGLIGIWIWSLITSGDPQDRELAATNVETVAGDDSDPTPTAEPEPTEEPDESMIGDANGGSCFAADGKAQFDQFVARFNDGDMDRLSEMLPGVDVSELPENQLVEAAYANGDFIHNGDEIDLADVKEFFAERYEAGERWDVLDAYPAEHYRNWNQAAPLEMYQDWKRENPEQSLIIVSGMEISGEEPGQQLLQGRVTIDCDAETIIGWDLQAYGGGLTNSVTVDQFSQLNEGLTAADARQVTAIVQADDRVDGGMLSAWEFTWTEARDDEDRPMRHIEVRTLDGARQISFAQYRSNWWLDQRGWMIYGSDDEAPPFSDEIALPMSWLPEIAAVLEDADLEPGFSGSREIEHDYSFTSSGGTERFLEIAVVDGVIDTVQVREYTPGGARVRPEIWVRDVRWIESIDPQQFEAATEPDFPELETDAPRYSVPAEDWAELEFEQVIPGFVQTEETYRIRWNDVEMELTVRPSRGGLDIRSVPPSIDESWTTAAAQYDWGTLVWAHRQFAGYPTEALWDDGRFLFELVVDREQMSPEHDWSLRELVSLANALSVPIDFDDPEETRSGISGGSGL